MIKSEQSAARQLLSEAVLTQNVRSPPAHAAGFYTFQLPPRMAALSKCTDCGARHVGICDAMPEHDLDTLSAAALIVRKSPGQRFIEEGETAEHFFTMSAGTARIFKALPDGREQVTSFASRGDFLGLAASSRYAYCAEAIDAVVFCRFNRAALTGLLTDFPAMERRLLDITRHELVLAQEQMLLLGRKSARERVASFLILRLSKMTDDTADARRGLPVSLPMSRGDIADYLGLRVETISRTLTRMKGDGLIRPGANAFDLIITNLPGLDACATGHC
jgi:CRP/FNR family transcriptional regulator